MIVLDSHCDTPSQILRGRDLGIDNSSGHVDFPKLRKGGVDAVFFALYTSNTLSADSSLRLALRMLSGVRDSVAAHPEYAALAYEPEDIIANKERGLTSIFLGMENGLPIEKDLSLLRLFHDFGVRYMTLTHNGDNDICDSAAEASHWNGLSPFGHEVVAEMNRLGIIVDIAHCSDKTFWDCIDASATPIVSTHSCCRALCGHRRNLTDDMIRALADKGGVIQINFYPTFLSDNAELAAESGIGMPGIKEVVDHIDHAVKIGGINAVGIGSDFDGIETTPVGLENISLLPRVFDEMSHRGYSDSDIEKIAGGNFLRVFKEVRNNKK